MKKTYQECKSIADFEEIAARVTNMVEGEVVVQRAAQFVKETSGQWKKDFCTKNLSRFAFTNIYRILMGEVQGNKAEYHYVPNPF